MASQLFLLELNEVNFDFVQAYARRGELPHFARLIKHHGFVRTTSEKRHDQLEPWIQWVTAHTGQSFSEHGVFRLGDIVNRDLPQIWEKLEDLGLRVGAICPMNAKHRLRDAAFFVPDPWTPTGITAPLLLKWLAAAVSQVVNDNAQSKVTVKSGLALIAGLVWYASPKNYGRYLKLALGSRAQSWKRALFLDLLLADIFVRQVRRTDPHFASLFLNAAAHVQHHYMFSSTSYTGELRNPEWYSPAGVDPVLEVYKLYDHVLGAIQQAFPAARMMVATGLHQEPYPEISYYWRLKNHEAFLRGIGVPFVKVDARMSRDFLLTCSDEEQAAIAAQILAQAVSIDGISLFEVDNRGKDIFAMLVYPQIIDENFRFRIGEAEHASLHANVAFVALKNGEHDGIGYFIDTGAPEGTLPAEFPLKDVPKQIANALNAGSLKAA